MKSPVPTRCPTNTPSASSWKPADLKKIRSPVALSPANPTSIRAPRVEIITASRDFYLSGGGLTIDFGVAESPFGPCFLAWCPHGLFRVAFLSLSDEYTEFLALQHAWPHACLCQNPTAVSEIANTIFPTHPQRQQKRPIRAWVVATPFQCAVWQRLLEIPLGTTTTYGCIAAEVGRPKATRAVGTAIGKNPLAFVIPCHRVVPKSGGIGNYRWSQTIKQSILDWETEVSETSIFPPKHVSL